VKQPENSKSVPSQLTAYPSDLLASNFPPAWLASNILQEHQLQDARFFVGTGK
jgi:hypothetical protein